VKRRIRITPPWLTALAVTLLVTIIPAGALASTAAPPASAASPSAPAASAASPATPVLNWQPCDNGFQCATARVPLDYRDPHGRLIDIAVIRHLATDPAHRIGSLFFNPGGPGGQGVAALPLWYTFFPAAVRARFDLVSFDPRGVGASTAVQCYPSAAAEQQALAGLPAGFPVGPAQVQAWDRVWAAFDHACGVSDGDLIAHLSTANVARDMDLLRQAVGDPRMNYLGVSYGTYLGATYANLFPGKVHAMVLDGNIDPVAWAAGYGTEARLFGTALRFGQDQGMAATLRAFLTLCGRAAPGKCAFSAGSAAATRAKYQALLRRLRRHPVTLNGTTVTYALATAAVGNDLYTVEPEPAEPVGWTNLATLLQDLWTGGGAAAPAHVPAAAQAYSGTEQAVATLCDDSPNPRDVGSYPVQAALAYARSGAFGPYVAWKTEPCAQWPAFDADRYTGPWNVPTARPLLVMDNTTDPATPYQGSLAMARDLARARLLTIDGWGHTEFLNPSTCAQAYESGYLINGTLPPAGTTCQPDQRPFS
jgi:pimeloyl-ACP methyl ester carboxylesterase